MGDVFYIIEEGTAKATKTFEPGNKYFFNNNF